MTKISNKLIINVLAFFFPILMFAQPLTTFPEESNDFLNELGKYMNSSNNNIKPIFEKFSEDVAGGKYTPEQFQKIREVANFMLERKMRANPYFNAYVEALNFMESRGFLGNHFDDWMSVNLSLLTDLKRSRNQDFSNFLTFCVDFLEKNSLRYSEDGLVWKVSAPNFRFQYHESEPFLKIEQVDLIAVRKEDSITIVNTSGIFYPLQNLWKGKNGRVTWARTGLSEKVYCTFDTYQLETKSNTYKVDTVTFYHPTFFDGPIQGKFEDKVIVITGSNISYPRFESFEKKLTIDNVGDNIKYTGGFQIEGSSIIGLGDKLNKAKMEFLTSSGALALRTQADKYVIRRGERIIAQDVEVSLYFDQDSIYHPSIDFRFDIPTRRLVLTRTGTGSSQIKFFNSFHQLEMEVEKVAWQIDSDSIEVGQAGMQNISNRPKEGVFESLDYYNDREYRRIQNIADYNPVATLKAYAQASGTRVLDANLVAKRFNPNLNLVSIKGLLNDLVEGGFIFYNEEKEEVIVKDKTFHYAEASIKKRDYDVIKAVSSSLRTNAILNLTNQTLDLNGVASIVVSDTQLVAIKPKDGNATFLKNRNIDFDGQVFAGFGIFWGKNFHFKYEKFDMELDSVKEFLLRIPTNDRDRLNMPILASLTTVIEDMTAVIQIDTAINKSSRVPLVKYPILYSLKPSRVYYGDKSVASGAYKRDNFYFELKPFVFDSLDAFNPAGVNFKGRLVSAGIFPEFAEVLRIQNKDLSLGFTTQAPPEGYPLYGGKGTYNNVIQLGNTGLRGKGTIRYLTATINSDDILFLPTKLQASADSFNLLPQFSGIQYPKVRGEKVTVDWRPYKDTMYVRSTTESPFAIFDGNYQFEGELALTPGGLYGDGVFDWQAATLYSRNLRFQSFGIDADSSNLDIKTTGSNTLAFSTKNVRSSLDFKTKIGKFKSNSNAINTEMPYTQYKTSMNEFDWNMDKKEILFTSTNENAYFLSTNYKQDSLIFSGKKANYNLETNLLKIEGVPYIRAADALVYPQDGLVEIEANANMKTLANAMIVADTINRYHVIKRASVNIEGKQSYKATGGFYEYNVDTKKQEIEFSSILVAKGKRGRLTTKGAGKLTDLDSFLVDNKTRFKGEVKLSAENKELRFEGFAKFISPKLTDGEWFSISSEIDRKNVIIKFDKPRNQDGQQLEVGLRIRQDTSLMYPLVLTPPISKRDQGVFQTTGIVRFDKNQDAFFFGDSLKIVSEAMRGNVLRFQNRDGKVTTEGVYTLSDKMKYLTIQTAGQSSMIYNNPKIQMLLSMGIMVNIPTKLLNIMIRDLQSNSFDVTDLTYNDSYFKNAISEFVNDEKDLNKIFKDLTEYERLFLPKSVTNKFAFFFANLNMTWNSDLQSFHTTSGTVGLSHINDIPFNKQFKGYLEIRSTRQSDELNIYIETSARDYYYFNYRIIENNGILSVYSSNINFNEALKTMKPKELEFKMPDGDLYSIKPTGPGAVTYFLNRMEPQRN